MEINHTTKAFVGRETESTKSQRQLAHVISGVSIPSGNLCTSYGNGDHIKRIVGKFKRKTEKESLCFTRSRFDLNKVDAALVR